MPKIVISYRRSDAAGIAGRISDKLRAHFGDDSVFMDVTSNKPGTDFRRQIAIALRRCDLMIAVIGPDWRGETEPGHARIMDENDFIAIEIRTALKSEIPILPVLVEDAEMPDPQKLPEDIKQLAYAHAAEVDVGRNFHRDMEALIGNIDDLLKEHGTSDQSADRRQGADRRRAVEPAKLAATRVTPVSASVWSSHGARRKIAALAAGLVVAASAPAILYYWPTTRPDPGSYTQASVDNRPMGDESGRTLTIKPRDTSKVAELRSVVFSRDGRLMAVAGEDGYVRIWDAQTFTLTKRPIDVRRLLPAPRPRGEPNVHRVAFSMEGDLIYSVGLDNTVAVIDLVTGRLRSQLKPEVDSRVSLFHSVSIFPRYREKDPDKFWVAAGGDDGCYRIWHVEKPELRRWRYANGDRLYSDCDIPAKVDPNVERRPVIAYSHLGRDLYAIGNEDGNVGLIFNEHRRKVFRAHEGPISELVFSPDSERFATASGDGKVKVWQVDNTDKPLRVFQTDVPVSSVAWRSDGLFLVSGGHDNILRVWDVAGNKSARTIDKAHGKDIHSVAYHPNGKWIVSASQDGSLKVWDDDSAPLLTLVAFSGESHVVYHRKGHYTGSADAHENISMTYDDGGIPRPMSDALKKRLYLSPAEFAGRFGARM